MNSSEIRLLPRLLQEMNQALSLQSALSSRETLLRLDAQVSFSSDCLDAFTSDLIERFAAAFGGALEDFRVSFDNDPYWRFADHGTNVSSLQTLRSGSLQELSLRVDINKNKLLDIYELKERFAEQSHFLYFFSERVPYLFTGEMRQCEDSLWKKSGTEQAVIFVCDADICLVGDYLMVCGGSHLPQWEGYLRIESAETVNNPALSCKKMHQFSQNKLNWQTDWVRHLTPLHFDVKTVGEQSPSAISRVLALRSATFFLLYTAEQTKEKDGNFVSIYQRGQAPVQVLWGDVKKGLDSTNFPINIEAGANQLNLLVRWLYDPLRTNDRLLTAQIYLATELRHTPQEDCFGWVIQNAKRLKIDLEARWSIFIEEKLQAYSEQERKFEDDVLKVSQGFDDQIGVMIQTLVTNGLATVVALVTAFVALLYKEPFNNDLFRAGLFLYAGYIVIFPIGFGLISQWGRFQAAEEEFNSRRKRINLRLGEQKTKEIIDASQFGKNNTRFKAWFAWATCLYLALVVAISLSALRLPQLIVNTKVAQPTKVSAGR